MIAPILRTTYGEKRAGGELRLIKNRYNPQRVKTRVRDRPRRQREPIANAMWTDNKEENREERRAKKIGPALLEGKFSRRQARIRGVNVCKRISWILSRWKRVSPVGATEGKRGSARGAASCGGAFTRRNAHTRFSRARTRLLFLLSPRCTGVENDREKEERKRARNELEEGGAIAGENGCARLRWRSEGRWEEGKDRGEVVTPWWPVYVSGIRRARLLSSFLSSFTLPPLQDGSGGGGGGAAPVLRFSTFSRFILTASSLNRFPDEIYGRAII